MILTVTEGFSERPLAGRVPARSATKLRADDEERGQDEQVSREADQPRRRYHEEEAPPAAQDVRQLKLTDRKDEERPYDGDSRDEIVCR